MGMGARAIASGRKPSMLRMRTRSGAGSSVGVAVGMLVGVSVGAEVGVETLGGVETGVVGAYSVA